MRTKCPSNLGRDLKILFCRREKKVWNMRQCKLKKCSLPCSRKVQKPKSHNRKLAASHISLVKLWRNISYLTRMRCVDNSGMCAVCEPHLFVPLVKLWAGSSYVTEASVRLSLNPINQHLWQNQTIWQYQSLKFRIFRTHIVLCHPFQAQKPAHSGAQWVPLLCLVEALFQNWSLTKVCVVPR